MRFYWYCIPLILIDQPFGMELLVMIPGELSNPPPFFNFSSHEPATIIAESQASSAVPKGKGYDTVSSAAMLAEIGASPIRFGLWPLSQL